MLGDIGVIENFSCLRVRMEFLLISKNTIKHWFFCPLFTLKVVHYTCLILSVFQISIKFKINFLILIYLFPAFITSLPPPLSVEKIFKFHNYNMSHILFSLFHSRTNEKFYFSKAVKVKQMQKKRHFSRHQNKWVKEVMTAETIEVFEIYTPSCFLSFFLSTAAALLFLSLSFSNKLNNKSAKLLLK